MTDWTKWMRDDPRYPYRGVESIFHNEAEEHIGELTEMMIRNGSVILLTTSNPSGIEVEQITSKEFYAAKDDDTALTTTPNKA